MQEKFEEQAIHFNQRGNSLTTGEVSWKSPSNIAFVKYWGKYGEQLPCNPSLSLTLNKAQTTTVVKYAPSNEGLKLVFFLDDQPNQKFKERINKYLQNISRFLPFLNEISLEVRTTNSFPHSTGIASSASGISALALCLCSIEYKYLDREIDDNFYQKASFLSRLGSGSACRSLWGPWVSWGKYEMEKDSSLEAGLPLNFANKFHRLGDAVLIVHAGEKSVSSSLGHSLMENHPFAQARFEQAQKNQNQLYQAISDNDFDSFIEIVESEALSLHAMMMTSNPGFMLFHPNSIEIMNRIREKRKELGLKMCFTLDAGPNIHLIYQLEQREQVLAFIHDELVDYCDKGQWIDDQWGVGPEKLI